MKISRALSIVIAPLLLLTGWLARLLLVVSLGTAVRFKVRGYDPRDLLSGHYLHYQISYGSGPLCQSGADIRETCVCVQGNGGDGFASAVWGASCDDPRLSQCEEFIRGSCVYGRFDAGLDRFYFPEEFQKPLLNVPQNASIEIRVSSNGMALVTGMFVDGVPIVEWARQP